MLALLCLFASSALAAIVLHEQEVSMNATSLTAGVFETFKLSTPITLVANRRYGVTFEFDYSKGNNNGRTYLGTRNVVTTQCGLFIPQNNLSWAIPTAYLLFGNYSFYLGTDLLGENMATAQATSGAQFSTIDDGGFGQTFDSGAGGELNNITLFLARDMGVAQALVSTMRVYDLDLDPVIDDQYVEFLVRAPTPAPTSAPTTSPTTPAPTSSPTTPAPTAFPTTSAPTTTAPTDTPTTGAPTTAAPTSTPTTSAPSSMPTAAPTTEDTVSGSPQIAAGALATVMITLLFL